MYRYITMVWNENDALAIQEVEFVRNKIQKNSTPWSVAYKCNGIVVLHTDEDKGRMQSIKLDNGGGIILGKIFKRPSDKDSLSKNYKFGMDESQKIIKSSGKYLIDHYWGRYVAFIKDVNTHANMALKGPVEGFNCYYIKYHHVTFFFSLFEDISQFGFLKLSVDWNHIAVHLKYFQLNKDKTAFDELYKLKSGECWQYNQSKVHSSLNWNPVKFSRHDIIEDPIEAAQLLRQTVVGCVSSWAGSHDKILHTLSGGLDSSIILASLMESRKAEDITCINYFSSSDQSGDERYFARLAAKKYGVKMIEKEMDASIIKLERLFDIVPAATPEMYMHVLERCTYEAQVARDTGSSVVFTGEGGDSLFFQAPTHFITSDYIHMHGLTPTLFLVALNTARLMNKSLWSVLYNAFRDHLTKPHGNSLRIICEEKSPILNFEVMRNIQYKDTFNHMIKNAGHLSNGKLLHIAMIDMPNRYHHAVRDKDFIELCYPLLSQPIIECCLKIPSYVLTLGGKDRGLARMAFKDELPKEILRRESKGGVQNYLQEIIDNNIDFVRETLLDGILVKEKLLNRDGLEHVLWGANSTVNPEVFNIFRYICTEIWLRKIIKSGPK